MSRLKLKKASQISNISSYNDKNAKFELTNRHETSRLQKESNPDSLHPHRSTQKLQTRSKYASAFGFKNQGSEYNRASSSGPTSVFRRN